MDRNTRKVRESEHKYKYKTHILKTAKNFPFPWDYIAIILLIIGSMAWMGGIGYASFKFGNLIDLIVNHYT